MGRETESESRHIDAVDFAFFKVVRQRRVASSPIRIHADPARAQHFAIADFEKTAFEFVSHNSSCFVKPLGASAGF
jgi:hypothetical protein